MTKHLYLFRHGETVANLEQRLMGGRGDAPLTAKGIAQAQALARKVQGIPLEVLYISSNSRAQETAQILNIDKSIPQIVTETIKEQDFGAMSGYLISQVPVHIDEAYRKDPYYFHHNDGESLDDVKKRVGAFIQKVMRGNQYQHIGLVTHENVIRAAIAYMKGIDREVVALKVPYCSLTHYFLDHKHKYHALAIAECY
ncbi:MAG: histidine phosphatase family protein [Candidatus Abawacabacteria bacterium]|nr:histidine phosphatase family protein [Candidatus Abawacabacteria bacterium]